MSGRGLLSACLPVRPSWSWRAGRWRCMGTTIDTASRGHDVSPTSERAASGERPPPCLALDRPDEQLPAGPARRWHTHTNTTPWSATELPSYPSPAWADGQILRVLLNQPAGSPALPLPYLSVCISCSSFFLCGRSLMPRFSICDSEMMDSRCSPSTRCRRISET